MWDLTPERGPVFLAGGRRGEKKTTTGVVCEGEPARIFRTMVQPDRTAWHEPLSRSYGFILPVAVPDLRLVLRRDTIPLDRIAIARRGRGRAGRRFERCSASWRNVFWQPCPAYRDCACTVYANRPRNCHEFRCKLLKNLEQGDISHEAAQEIVRNTLAVRNTMLELAGAPSANHPPLRALIRMCIENSKERAAHARLFFNFIILQKILDRFFRKNPRFSSRGPAAT